MAPSRGPHWGPPKCPHCGEPFVQQSPTQTRYGFNEENMCANCNQYSQSNDRLDGEFTPVITTNKYVEAVENLTHTSPEELADGCCPCGAVLVGISPAIAMTTVGFLLFVRRLFPKAFRVKVIRYYRFVRGGK